MELVWHLFPSRPGHVLGRACYFSSLCGGLYTRERNGFSSRRRNMGKTSHRTGMSKVHSNSIKSKASEASVQPLKLLSSTKAVSNLTVSLEEELGSTPDASQSLYRVELATSNDPSSDFSDANAGILVCMIGENGESILHRISAVSSAPQVLSSDRSKLEQTYEHLCFQRGSVDVATFWGPNIGRLAELWIGPESGSWRLGRVNVLVIHSSQRDNNGTDDIEKSTGRNIGLDYVFQTNEVLLGDSGEPAVELRPTQVKEFSGSNTWLKVPNLSRLATRTSSKDVRILQEESLKDYENLKFSLLLYDTILVVSGTSIAAIAGGQEISRGFALGGILGFIYLLLLQKAVDRLPGPAINNSLVQDSNTDRESNVEKQGQDMDMKVTNMSTNTQLGNRSFRNSFVGFRGPLTTLSWILAVIFVTLRYTNGDTMISWKPQELLAGAAGFLTCKIATIIAGFRPIPIDLKDPKK